MFSPWTPLPKHIAALAERFDDSTFPSIPPGAAPLIPEFSVILGATEHLSFAAGSPRALCLRATAQLREAPSQTHLVFLPFMPVAPGSAGQKCRLRRLRNFRDANTGGTNLIFLLTWLSSFFSFSSRQLNGEQCNSNTILSFQIRMTSLRHEVLNLTWIRSLNATSCWATVAMFSSDSVEDVWHRVKPHVVLLVSMSILFTKAEYVTGLYSTLTAPSEQQWCAIL